MKAFIAAAGLTLAGFFGAGHLDAQGVNIRITKNDKTVQVKTGGSTNVQVTKNTRITRNEGFREGAKVEKQPSGHFITVEKKVWVPGHYETRIEKVFVPGHYVTKIEKVYVPAKHVDVRERRVDNCGNVYYVTVCKTIPAHYIDCEKKVWVAGCYVDKEVQHFVPGRYEIKYEKVWVEDDCNTCDTKPAPKPGHGHGKPHDDNGHGNDPGHHDPSNPGKGGGGHGAGKGGKGEGGKGGGRGGR